MISVNRVRAALAGTAVLLAGLLASCASPPPPPPPAPPPSVSLSPKIIEQASAYRLYVERASAISPAFADGAQVAAGVKTGAAYEPAQFLRGAIAYGAIAALQDPTFLAGVRTYGTTPERRQEVAYAIMKDPAYVVALPGSASAAGLVISALGQDGGKLLTAGRAVKQAAYDVQRSKWSKADVAGRDARLVQAKTLSATQLVGDADETARLQQASVGATPLGLTGQTAAAPYTPLVIRSLAVAALATLGYGGDQYMESLMPLLAEPASTTCLKLAKLNLYQCLAVSKPHYEDVFCLGVHSMMDTGQCLLKGAGAAAPLEVKPTSIATTPAPGKTTTASAASGPSKKR